MGRQSTVDFRDLVVSYLLNMSRPILFALPLLWRRRFKTLLAMTARADEHTRQRIRTGETDMRALRTKDRDESHRIPTMASARPRPDYD